MTAEDARRVPLAPVLPRFSRLAIWCFAALVLTGTYLSWRQVGELGALVGTKFGLLLVAKLVLVLVILGFADRARRFVARHRRTSRNASVPAEHRQVRASVAVEVLVGVLVIGVTAVLVDTAPARTSYAPPFRAELPIGREFAVVPALPGGTIDIQILPARRGTNDADIYLRGATGELVDVPELAGMLLDPSDPDVRLAVAITGVEPGHFAADSLSIPYVGDWQLRLTARLSDFDEASVTVPFTAR